MKIILYMVYALMFYIYSLLPINKNKTTFIMTHDDSINGNIMRMYYKVKEQRPNEVCCFITKKKIKQSRGWKRLLNEVNFICISSFHLATSKVIFLDNIFLPMAFMRFKKSVQIVQLWHGCNTLKKFGQLSNTGQLKKLEKKANSRYTHLITSSTKMNELHQKAFEVKEEKIYALGLPRMDSLFQDDVVLEKEREIFYKSYPELRGKKLILYAPTFRDNDLNMTDPRMDLTEVVQELPEGYRIMTKFHPFVCQNYQFVNQSQLIDMSRYDDLNRLLLVADILITDYSSIIFEYAILDKPIIFYAYDLEEYAKEIRGFYYDYENYVPGVIVRDKSKLLESIQEKVGCLECYDEFIDIYLGYKDSNSAQRIFDTVY